MVARALLMRYGYDVLEAENGEHALEVVSEHGGTVDLLLTDVMMPKMSGPVLAARLREALPHLPVIHMTGYAESVVAKHGQFEDGDMFIKKPFTAEELLRKVRESLDTPFEGQ